MGSGVEGSVSSEEKLWGAALMLDSGGMMLYEGQRRGLDTWDGPRPTNFSSTQLTSELCLLVFLTLLQEPSGQCTFLAIGSIINGYKERG